MNILKRILSWFSKFWRVEWLFITFPKEAEYEFEQFLKVFVEWFNESKSWNQHFIAIVGDDDKFQVESTFSPDPTFVDKLITFKYKSNKSK